MKQKFTKIWFCTDDEVNGKETYYWKLPFMLLPASLGFYTKGDTFLGGMAFRKNKIVYSFYSFNVFIPFKITWP